MTTSESFVPLAVASAAGASGFIPLHLKSSAPSTPNCSPMENKKPHSTEDCASPKITLQRENDVVTAIRIECDCGQVIELNCVY